VTFIATDRQSADTLSDAFPDALVLHGTGTNEAALRRARAEGCDVLFSVGPDDCRALVASLLARERFGVKSVIALTNAEEDTPAYTALSIDSVCAPAVLAQALIDLASSEPCE
jgi:trk system potassium uptake protein TrkA